MGYYRDFLITTPKTVVQREDVEDIVNLLKKKSGYSYFEVEIMYQNTLNYISIHDVKWYDCEEHMLEISRRYKNVLFRVDTDGEDCHDLNTHFFMNGKTYYEKAKIIMPEFDESKMKEK